MTQAATIEALVKMGVPVMGHVGLTPQSVHQFGGYRIQGRGEADARNILDDALAVEQSGAFAVVLEGIPVQLAREITRRVSIPTIGIGAGMHCDGQILVVHDMLGLFDDFTPKFVKRYANLKDTIGGRGPELHGGGADRGVPGGGAHVPLGGRRRIAPCKRYPTSAPSRRCRHGAAVPGARGSASSWCPPWGTCTKAI